MQAPSYWQWILISQGLINILNGVYGNKYEKNYENDLLRILELKNKINACL